MTKHGRRSALSVALVIFALAAFSLGDPSSGSASHGGLQNPGFEDGLPSCSLGSDCWLATAVDGAFVVGTETSTQCPTYASMGGVQVKPFKGSKALRLGQCRQGSNSQQPKGANKVAQTFRANSSPLRFAFQLYSWEHRAYDEFSFDLKQGTTSTGLPVSMIPVKMAGVPGGERKCSTNNTLPCKFTIDAGKSGQFVAPGDADGDGFRDWNLVAINIPSTLIGQELTLSYSVTGGKDSGFATWAYWDNVNTPPVAKFSVVNPQCSNDTDDDLDGRTNDGCPAVGAPETQCPDVIDNDNDGFINDGCSSLGDTSEGIFESDVVQFTDESFDVDGPQDIVSWHWVINGETIDAQNPTSIFSNEGTYSACLTVTDTFEDTNTVCAGGTTSDGTHIAVLTIDNAPPIVNALNVETLAGQPVQLFGRTLEPGWEDALTAAWQVGGQAPFFATIDDDNLAFLSTGVVSGEVTTTTDLAGRLTVTDPAGDTGFDDFQVSVVVPTGTENLFDRHETTNNSLADPPVLVSDASHLSWIQEVGDQDFFEVLLPDQACPPEVVDCLLPAGGELLVTLKGPGGAGLNADYDLVILAQTPSTAGFQSGESGQTTVDTAAGRFGAGRFGAGRFGAGRFGAGRFGAGRFGAGRFGAGRFGSFTYPLSQTGFNGLSGDSVSSADITLEELGLGSLAGNGLSVAAYSANPGTGEEAALAQSNFSGTKFFAIVLGANGAFSNSQPYTLQIETSIPFDLAEALGPEVCVKSPLVGSDPSNPGTSTVVDLNPDFIPTGGTKTLIITQRERMIALADDPITTGVNEGVAAWNVLEAKLEALAQHPAVQADILSMPSVAPPPTPEDPDPEPLVPYDEWDSNPCEVDRANAVAAAIRAEIQSRLGPTIQYVVIVGDDDVVPQRRVPDENIIGNEASYILDSLLTPGSPLFSSVLYGQILTDDYYVDDVPTPWQGRELYVPDRPIGRLVETPQEIGAAADAFLTAGPNGGLLDYRTGQAATALVTGYDFFSDGANVVAGNLGSRLATTRLIDETPLVTSDDWTANDLRCSLLGQGSGCSIPGVAAANAHYTHYAALSASGFSTNTFNFVSSNEVANAVGASPALDRRVVFTMGCHGGFNAPDRASLPPDAGLGIDPALDFAQAMARQQAVWIASTGYGYGDDMGLSGTELLLTYFSDEMVQGDDVPDVPPDVFIGDALRDAKETFLLSLASMTAFDEKSSIQLTMFGLPMYQVLVPPEATAASTIQAPPANEESFMLTIEDGGVVAPPTTYTIAEVPNDNGTYFTARPAGTEPPGDAQATAFRAVEARIVIPIPPGNPVQGVLIKAGTYTDTPSSDPPFDPLIARPTQEWLVDDFEPQTCLDAFWPSVPVTVNSIDAGGAQALVVTPGQFRCTTPPGDPVRGVQRKYHTLTIELLHSNLSDTEPPTVNEVSIAPGAAAGSLDVTVEASDVSGIAGGVLLKYSGGAITSIPFEVAPPQTSGAFTINVPGGAAAGVDIAGQIRDINDNVAVFTAKGQGGFTFLNVTLSPDPKYVTPGVPTTFQLSVPDFAQLEAPFYTLEYGDGVSSSGPVTGATMTIPTGTPDDPAHPYPDSALPTTARVKVMDATGRLGSDTTTVRRQCDPVGDAPRTSSDLVGCDVTTTPTRMTISIRVVGEIQTSGQYRVNIQTATTNAQLKFDNGHATGPLSSLEITLGDPGEVRFSFSLAEVGLTNRGDQLQWSADAQTVGFADRMPDSGVFTFVLP